MNIWLIKIPIYLLLIFLVLSFLFFLTYAKPVRHMSKLTPKDMNLDYENVRLETEDGLLLDAWLIKNPASKTALVAMHGYPMDKGNILPMISFLAKKHNILMFDFRAMGASGGFFSTGGVKEKKDIKAAVDYLEKNNFKNIGIFGFSMGAAAALTYKDDRIKAVIADAPYYDLESILSGAFSFLGVFKKPFMFFCKIFSKIFLGIELSEIKNAYAQNANIHALLIHGEKDQTVEIWHSQKIKKILKNSILIEVANSAHGENAMYMGEKYEKEILLFLDKNLK